MTDREPTLLDYLLSWIDPRRERIRLPEIEDERSRKAAGEGVPAALEAAPPVPGEKIRIREESAGVPSEPAAEALPAPAPVPEPDSTGPLPWRTLLALFLGLAAQGSFEPPVRSVSPGTGLYLLAAAFALWAFWSGELQLPSIPSVGYRLDGLRVRRTLLWAALPSTGLAFLLLGGNRFTTLNLGLWLLSVFLLSAALWQQSRPVDAGRLLRMPSSMRISITPWAVLVGLGIAVVLFFRFYHLEQVPSQMFSDHAEKLQDVQDVINGQTRIFFPRNTGREFVQMYLTAFTASVLGYELTFMALKMGTALAGIITLPFVYLLGVELANRRVGLLAMVMAGMSYWLNVITRVALRFSLYPLFLAPVLYFVVRGLRRGSRNDFIWAGIALGLGLHGYSPFRFVPLLVVAVVILFVLHAGSRARRSQAIVHLGVITAIALVVFLPLLRFMFESEANRSIVLYRSLTRISTFETELPGEPLEIFADNMWKVMTMFAWDNGGTWVHSVVFRPALDVVSAVLFYLGYFLLIARYFRARRWEDAAMIIAVPFLLLPSAMSLAFPSENPSLNRTGGAIVPVFLIAALMLDSVMEALRTWGGRQWGITAAWSVGGFLLLWSGLANYDLVFRQYDAQFTASSWNTTELGRVIRGYADSIGSEQSAWVIPWPHWVDTRLVGINAGVYIRDYAIPRDGLVETTGLPGPKMFLFNPQDLETLAELERLYPGGLLKEYMSEVPGKNFMIYLAAGGG